MDWRTGRLPLKGLLVVDWSVFWAGAYLGMMLHDLGAQVVKVESPYNWDPMRTILDVNPGARGAQQALPPEERCNLNQHFNEWNRGKLSLAVALEREEGRRVLLDLLARADIFIENHRPHVKEKLGIAYEDVRKVKPDIVYLSISGFGQDGPERDALALGSPVELASGLFSLNGYHGQATPAKTGFSYADPVSALVALGAILLALRQRRRTGKGRFIDIAMRDALSFGIGSAFVDWALNGRERPRLGNRHPSYAPQGVYRAYGADEWIAISVRNDQEWQALVRLMGNPDWATDPELATVEGRRRHHDLIDQHLERWTSQHCARALEAALQEAGVPAGAVLDYRQLRFDPQLNARGMTQEVQHPLFGTEVRTRSLWQRGPCSQPIERPAPCFGQHNRYVLREILGYSEQDIQRLEEQGIIASSIHPSPQHD
ncbi:MAG: CoA transferase [Dehalococcoidia bacterium]|jgi:crotonobetainyl-CoA:carnitine CoA-transferase CaiB-like acyl-CoA transferase|nr:CoA transferase [Dehalococcoidia bacterium]MDW8008926.1 CoA transferase [Chloroflexota bacterium]